MLCSTGAAAPLINIDRAEQIERIAGNIPLSAARQAVIDLEHTIALLDTNVNARLAVEVLLLDLPLMDAIFTQELQDQV